MERMTKRSDFTGLILIDGRGYGEAYFGAKEDYDRITKALNKLAAYEDAEEQMRLVELPCKAGNTIYRIVGNLIITELTVMGVTSPEYKTVFENGERGPDLYDNDFGKTVFLSRDEAEKALEGMNND